MTYPDKPATLALLENWQKHCAAIEKMMAGINDCMGLDINGPMFEMVWGVFGAYEAALGAFIGDHGNWLEWFRAENEMGARGMAAGYDGSLKPVKTLGDLYGLIAESRKRVDA